MQASKKTLEKKKGKPGETIHMEGKCRCDCLVRNYRKWLGKKRGKHLETQPEPPTETI